MAEKNKKEDPNQSYKDAVLDQYVTNDYVRFVENIEGHWGIGKDEKGNPITFGGVQQGALNAMEKLEEDFNIPVPDKLKGLKFGDKKSEKILSDREQCKRIIKYYAAYNEECFKKMVKDKYGDKWEEQWDNYRSLPQKARESFLNIFHNVSIHNKDYRKSFNNNAVGSTMIAALSGNQYRLAQSYFENADGSFAKNPPNSRRHIASSSYIFDWGNQNFIRNDDKNHTATKTFIEWDNELKKGGETFRRNNYNALIAVERLHQENNSIENNMRAYPIKIKTDKSKSNSSNLQNNSENLLNTQEEQPNGTQRNGNINLQ